MMRMAAVLLVVAALGPARQVSRAEVVTVHGWVAGENGRPVSPLAASDIEIFVDDAPVAVQAVEPRTPGLSLVVLIDKSRTVGWDAGRLAGQLDHFRAQLDPADRVMLATTGGRPFSLPFRGASTEWRRDVQRAADLAHDEGYGPSPIWDALHHAVTLLAGEPPPRSVLLLTDGRATGNRHGLVDAAVYAMANGVSVNVIAKNPPLRLSQGGDRAVLVQPAATLQRVSAYTGGQTSVGYPEQKERAERLFEEVAANLNGLHAFRFIPPHRDGTTHRLEIRVKRPRHRVQAPLVFVAPASS